jgi:hypothetical protein
MAAMKAKKAAQAHHGSGVTALMAAQGTLPAWRGPVRRRKCNEAGKPK